MVTRGPALDENGYCYGCRAHVDHHYSCKVQVWVCHEPCAHPGCHVVKGLRINQGPIQKRRPACKTCGMRGPVTDAEGVREWETRHHQEVVE